MNISVFLAAPTNFQGESYTRTVIKFSWVTPENGVVLRHYIAYRLVNDTTDTVQPLSGEWGNGYSTWTLRDGFDTWKVYTAVVYAWNRGGRGPDSNRIYIKTIYNGKASMHAM